MQCTLSACANKASLIHCFVRVSWNYLPQTRDKKPCRFMFEHGLLLIGKDALDKIVNGYRYVDAVFHIQATQSLH